MKLLNGTVHQLPSDLRESLNKHAAIRTAWNDITPLARNEFICWITSGALAETRPKRIKVGLSKMRGGMRRPCCWAGWPHRERNSK